MTIEGKALHELDPEERFSDRANDYAKHRPDYPDDAIKAILRDLPAGPIVVDVGAGTGISSRRLAMNGARVIAVEPNAAMRASAEPDSRVQYVDGSAEEIPVHDEGADCVTAFQAFHWFRPAESFAEFHRILRDGGRLALVWNERDDGDEFTREYGAIIREASNNHPAENRLGAADALFATDRFGDIRRERFRYAQRHDFEGLLGRVRSASYLPSAGEPYERLQRSLRELYEKWGGGDVTLVYRTEVFLATKR